MLLGQPASLSVPTTATAKTPPPSSTSHQQQVRIRTVIGTRYDQHTLLATHLINTTYQHTLSTQPTNKYYPPTLQQQPQIPQLVLGMGERTRSGLTESPTTLDSPVRMKPTLTSLPSSEAGASTGGGGNKLHPVILSPEKGDTVLYGSPTKSVTTGNPHEENDAPYFKSTPKGNRRVVKRGTTSIERYADRNVTVRRSRMMMCHLDHSVACCIHILTSLPYYYATLIHSS